MPFDYNKIKAKTQTLYNQTVNLFKGLGWRIVPTSGYRSPAHNAKIKGSSKNSQHMVGEAFDFVVYDQNGKRVDPMLVQATIAASGLDYGQNIAEYGAGMGPRNHLSVPSPTNQRENKRAMDGRYSAHYDIKPSLLDKGKALLTNAGTALGMISPVGMIGTALTTENADGETILDGANPFSFGQGTINRVALAVLAVIFIAAAVFAFKANDLVSTAKTLVK